MSLEIINCKVCLIGSSSVGKSCVSNRYIENKFDEKLQCTINAAYFKKIVETPVGRVQLNIWDTAGQEKYRALGKHFYKDAFIICFIYDITKKETFEDIKNIWYPDLKKYGEKYTVTAVIGNKIDLYMNKEVADIDAQNFAKEIGAVFGYVSAKDGIGVNEVFDKLVSEFIKPEFSALMKKIKEKRRGSFMFKKSLNKHQKRKECC